MQQQEPMTKMPEATLAIGGAPGSYVQIPERWLRFARRCLGLPPGRYTIHLTVHPSDCDWTVQDLGKVER